MVKVIEQLVHLYHCTLANSDFQLKIASCELRRLTGQHGHD